MIYRASLILLLFASTIASADEALWLKLKSEPNMIVLMRNAESAGNLDGADMLAWDTSGRCRGESKLTEKGKRQAEKIGNAFASRGIHPLVISSPMCRCTETAEIAFGKYLTHPDLRQRPPDDADGEAIFQDRVTAMLIEHRGTSPLVLVNHRPNINILTMELLSVGDLLVGSISDDGEVEVIDIFDIEL